MTRAWWLKGVLVVAVIAAAVMALLPTVMGDQAPRFLRRHIGTMRPGVDVVGGLRFVYEVDEEEAIYAKLALMAPLVESHLRSALDMPALTVETAATDLLLIKYVGVRMDQARLASLLDQLGLVQEQRHAEAVLVRLDDDVRKDVLERHTQQKFDSIDTGDPCWGGRVEREGNRIVVELPQIRTSEAARTRYYLER